MTSAQSTNLHSPRSFLGKKDHRKSEGQDLAEQNMTLYVAEKELREARENKARLLDLLGEAENDLVLTFARLTPHVNILNTLIFFLSEEKEMVFRREISEEEVYSQYESIASDIFECYDQRATHLSKIHDARVKVKVLESKLSRATKSIDDAQDHLDCVSLVREEFILEYFHVPFDYRHLVSIDDNGSCTVLHVARQDIRGGRLSIYPDGITVGEGYFSEQICLMKERDHDKELFAIG